MTLTWFSVDTPLPSGPMRVAVTARGVVAASFTPEGAAALPPGEELRDPAADRRAVAVRARFADYFSNRSESLELPIDWRLTTGPQQVVLQALQREVGYGRTVTYGELAALSGAFDAVPEQRGLAARAVGSMVASNPVSLLIPCHRVVAASGLGGFGDGAQGMAVKRWLLTLEGSLQPTLDWQLP